MKIEAHTDRRKLFESDAAEAYYSLNKHGIAKPYDPAVPFVDHTEIDMLKFLWGLPYDNLIMNWINGLRPSVVLATPDDAYKAKRPWEVVVYLDEYEDDKHSYYFVRRITQVVAVSLIGVRNAPDLIAETRNALRAQE